MSESLLYRTFGRVALLIHGDTLVLDRWKWLKERLPRTRNAEKLLDCGCGNGALTMGAASRGYIATGISNEQETIDRAQKRANSALLENVNFVVQDLRAFTSDPKFFSKFEFVLSCEVIEHLFDDRALMHDMAKCLKPGGRLLLTTPNYHYIAITSDEEGPRSEDDDENYGGHVRRGYTPGMFQELCQDAGLIIEEISYCSGMISQKLTKLLRIMAKINYKLGWLIVLPLRILPPFLDGIVTRLFRWTFYSICLQAYKPRFQSDDLSEIIKSKTLL